MSEDDLIRGTTSGPPSANPSQSPAHAQAPPPARAEARARTLVAAPARSWARIARRGLTSACMGLIVVAALGRLCWLGDMEYKSDEREWVDTLVNLGRHPIPRSHPSPITPASRTRPASFISCV